MGLGVFRHFGTGLIGLLCFSACEVGTINIQTGANPPANVAASPIPPLSLQSASVTLNAASAFMNPASAFSGTPAGALRDSHCAVSIHSGTSTNRHEVILVTGGEDPVDILSSAAYFDTATNTWSAAPSMIHARINHTANVIKVGSDLHEAVLVAGGFDQSLNPLSDVEIYDPVGGAGGTPIWRAVASMNQGRGYHTATTLTDGRVLVVAGSTDIYTHPGTDLASAEIYNPVNDTWTTVAPYSAPVIAHMAALIQVGPDHHDAVLVAGGYNDVSTLTATSYYDTAIASWVSAGNLPVDASAASINVLPNGSVMISGGQGAGYAKFANSEIYTPSQTSTPSTTWVAKATMDEGRYAHTGTLLPNQSLLAVGGFGGGGEIMDSDFYSVSGNVWHRGATSTLFRNAHTANLLEDGRVLIYGTNEYGPATVSNITEIYQTYTPVAPIPTSGVAPYTYTLKSGAGHIYANGVFVPDQYTAGTSVVTVTDSAGATADFTVITTP